MAKTNFNHCTSGRLNFELSPSYVLLQSLDRSDIAYFSATHHLGKFSQLPSRPLHNPRLGKAGNSLHQQDIQSYPHWDAQRHSHPSPSAAPVGVDHGRRAGRRQRRVGERRRGPGAHRPRDRPAVEAADRRAEVTPLAGRQPELGDAGHPQLVGAPGAEQVRPVRQQRQVGGGAGDASPR